MKIRKIKKIVEEMKDFLAIKAVKDIADSKEEKCICAETALKDGILCDFCEANSLIAEYDQAMKEDLYRRKNL